MNFFDLVVLFYLYIFISYCIVSVCIKFIEVERNYVEIDFIFFFLMLVMRIYWVLINWKINLKAYKMCIFIFIYNLFKILYNVRKRW